MDATIVGDRLVAAFQGDGEIIYLMFERSYWDDGFPKNPKWSCVGFGVLAEVMQRIFALASDCERGLRRSSKGCIEPEKAITAWLDLLAVPVAMPEMWITLRENAVSPMWNPNLIPEELSGAGYGTVADRLLFGERVSKHLHHDATLFRLLYGTHGPLMTRLLFEQDYAPVGSKQDGSLGYRPRRVHPLAIALPNCRQLMDGARYLIQDGEGSWRCQGNAVDIVADHICRLWRAELATPGIAGRSIAALRNHLADAPAVPDDTLVRVDRSMRARSIRDDQVLGMLPARIAVRESAYGYEFVLPRDSELLWNATDLPSYCTTWSFADSGAQRK